MTDPEGIETITPVLPQVGAQIASARTHALMTQSMLADSLGVTQTAVSYWEAGKRDMGVADLLRIAEVIGVTASSLLPAGRLEAAGQPDTRPDGIWGRVELPGRRDHTGWISGASVWGTEGLAVRDWDGRIIADVVMGPGCQVVRLPTPLKRPEPVKALPALGWGWDEGDGEDETWSDDDD